MSRTSRVLVAATVAAALLCTMAAGSAANRLQITNNTRGFRINWPSFTVRSGTVSVTCGVTMEGTFVLRTFTKPSPEMEYLPIGHTNSVIVRSCSGGAFAVLSEIMRFRIRGFTGTLPNITGLGIAISNFDFTLEDGRGANCLGNGGAIYPAGPSTLNGSRQMTSLSLEEGVEVPFTGLCEGIEPAHFTGSATVTDGGFGLGKPEFSLI